MSDLQTILSELQSDPILTYSLLAAFFLAGVCLAAGWARLDFVPLFRPLPLLKLGLSVLAAIGLLLLADWGNELLRAHGWLAGLLGLGTDPDWPLGGLGRFPLYVVALAYGPTAGLLAGGLFAAFEARGVLPGWPQAVLMLELIILGWLSIYPSPREYRWAGPLNALVAYALAWLTGGVAVLQAMAGGVAPKTFWLQQQSSLGGLLLSVLLLFVMRPALYRRLFFRSRLHDLPPAAPPPNTRTAFSFDTFDRRPRRDLPALPPPYVPELESRLRRVRALEA
ncbi:MAG TPA: hypothetical protein VF171_02425, partial [Trueperaceae bacterium]